MMRMNQVLKTMTSFLPFVPMQGEEIGTRPFWSINIQFTRQWLVRAIPWQLAGLTNTYIFWSWASQSSPRTIEAPSECPAHVSALTPNSPHRVMGSSGNLNACGAPPTAGFRGSGWQLFQGLAPIWHCSSSPPAGDSSRFHCHVTCLCLGLFSFSFLSQQFLLFKQLLVFRGCIFS